MRFDTTGFQQLWIICQARSDIAWLSGRGGLDPLSIEYAAAGSDISEKGGRPVRTCLEKVSWKVSYR